MGICFLKMGVGFLKMEVLLKIGVFSKMEVCFLKMEVHNREGFWVIQLWRESLTKSVTNANI